MIDTAIKLNGYCVPYNQLMRHGDEYHIFQPGVFTAMLNGKLPPIDVRWGSHEDTAEIIAHTDNRNVGFFEDAHGLAFHADIARCHLFKVAQITQGKMPADRCSVPLVIDDEPTTDTHLDLPVRQITRAYIEHLAVGLPASGYDTAVWAPDTPGFPEDAPYRIRELEARWQAGHAAHIAKQNARRVVASNSTSKQARLAPMLNSRRAQHAKVQRAFALAMGGIGPRGSSSITGHAALGRAFNLGEVIASLRGKVR